jgi:hypothetical protein
MNETTYKAALIGVAVAFTVVFCVVVVPPLIEEPDIIGAFGAGFVNPYASGYSTDVVFCWLVLAIWVLYERTVYSVKRGWICLALGVVPGVAVGFPLYLVVRHNQMNQSSSPSA